MEEWEQVLSKQEALLRRTSVVELELVESEIGLEGMYFMAALFRGLGFDIFTLEAKDAAGQPHWSLTDPESREDKCNSGHDSVDLEGSPPQTPELEKRGFSLYGENAMRGIRLNPLCFCQGETLKDECRYRLSKQVALIRVGTPAHREAGRRFGSCPCGSIAPAQQVGWPWAYRGLRLAGLRPRFAVKP